MEKKNTHKLEISQTNFVTLPCFFYVHVQDNILWRHIGLLLNIKCCVSDDENEEQFPS